MSDVDIVRCQCGTEFEDDYENYLCVECRRVPTSGINTLICRRDRIIEELDKRGEAIGVIVRRYGFLRVHLTSFHRIELSRGDEVSLTFQQPSRCNDRYVDSESILIPTELLEGENYEERAEAYYKAERARIDQQKQEEKEREAEKRRLASERRERELYVELKQKFEGSNANQT
jgi:hypothetical protein